ncbi:MAG TPA: MFS transporter [Candidatus Dojkabacteria bacterium]|nr:MFS transporter [Candidatus Dojkabacteria bacterium]
MPQHRFKEVEKIFKKLNRVVIYLTISDVFTWGTYMIISALTGLYLAQKLGQNAIQFVGIGTAIYFLTRAIFQIPLGRITDKYKNDKDEILILFVGILLMGVPFIFYPYISLPIHYYLLQFVFGIGVAFNVTNWRKLFALNVDGGREGRQYALYETIVSACTAVLSIVGGIIANLGTIYFDMVISFAGIVIMLGSIWVVLIYRYEERKSRKK